MKTWQQLRSGMIALLGMFILILDTKTALRGAANGIEICLRTVIPSIFPFLILSIFVNMAFTGIKIPFLTPIQKLCAIPSGAESIFLLGFLGGYPVGAQSIVHTYSSNILSEKDAHRMLGFCSNAGPAFIFGMGSQLFQSVTPLWVLWGIHIFSAILVGALLPNREKSSCRPADDTRATLPNAVENSVKTIAVICGWVIGFRVLIAFLDHWILWILPQTAKIAVIGFLELANGCDYLTKISNDAFRFILFSAFLGFGGICVSFQTVSVTKKLGTGMYFPGKILQCIISFALSSVCQYFIFSQRSIGWLILSAIILLLVTIIVLFTRLNIRKKVVAIAG